MKLKYRKIPSFRFPVVPGDRVVGVAAILENGGLVVDTEKMQINAKSTRTETPHSIFCRECFCRKRLCREFDTFQWKNFPLNSPLIFSVENINGKLILYWECISL